MVKYTGRGLVVKRPGVLSKVQLLNLVLGVGVFSLLPNVKCNLKRGGSMQKVRSNLFCGVLKTLSLGFY